MGVACTACGCCGSCHCQRRTFQGAGGVCRLPSSAPRRVILCISELEGECSGPGSRRGVLLVATQHQFLLSLDAELAPILGVLYSPRHFWSRYSLQPPLLHVHSATESTRRPRLSSPEAGRYVWQPRLRTPLSVPRMQATGAQVITDSGGWRHRWAAGRPTPRQPAFPPRSLAFVRLGRGSMMNRGLGGQVQRLEPAGKRGAWGWPPPRCKLPPHRKSLPGVGCWQALDHVQPLFSVLLTANLDSSRT